MALFVCLDAKGKQGCNRDNPFVELFVCVYGYRFTCQLWYRGLVTGSMKRRTVRTSYDGQSRLMASLLFATAQRVDRREKKDKGGLVATWKIYFSLCCKSAERLFLFTFFYGAHTHNVIAFHFSLPCSLVQPFNSLSLSGALIFAILTPCPLVHIYFISQLPESLQKVRRRTTLHTLRKVWSHRHMC